MKVGEIEELEDGSANIQLEDISKEELQLLVQEGFVALLRKALDQFEKEKTIPALFKEKVG